MQAYKFTPAGQPYLVYLDTAPHPGLQMLLNPAVEHAHAKVETAILSLELPHAPERNNLLAHLFGNCEPATIHTILEKLLKVRNYLTVNLRIADIPQDVINKNEKYFKKLSTKKAMAPKYEPPEDAPFKGVCRQTDVGIRNKYINHNCTFRTVPS
jgi:hypothetical protein